MRFAAQPPPPPGTLHVTGSGGQPATSPLQVLKKKTPFWKDQETGSLDFSPPSTVSSRQMIRAIGMLDQTSGEHLLTSKLLLATTAADVSQPLPLGDNNQVLLQAWIESSSTSLASTPVQVQLQTSSDLDIGSIVGSGDDGQVYVIGWHAGSRSWRSISLQARTGWPAGWAFSPAGGRTQ